MTRPPQIEDHARLHAEIARLTEDNEALRQELATTRQTLDRLLASASWRLTAPLRSMLERAKRARAGETPARERWTLPLDAAAYRRWLEDEAREGRARREALRAQLASIRERPTLGLLLVVGDEPDTLVRATLDSVRRQIAPDWQLCIVDDASTAPNTARTIGSFTGDPRVIVRRRETRDRLAARRTALDLSQERFIAFIEPGDVLAEEAVGAIGLRFARDPHLALLFTDEDVIVDGTRSDPMFKPGWSPDLLRALPYLGGLCIYDRARLLAAGGLRSDAPGWEDYDLQLRLAAAAGDDAVGHLPAILLHRPPGRSARPEAGACRPVADRLAAEAPAARVEWSGSAIRIRRPASGARVSVIVPTRDRADLLERCIRGVLASGGAELEVLIVDNESREPATHALFEALAQDNRVRRLPFEGRFNWSAMNNAAAAAAAGDVLVLLNNDIEVLDPDWLSELVAETMRPEIGIVGAKLLYPDGRIQHAGVWLGPEGMARHGLRLSPGEARGYLDCLVAPRNVAAVTGACLAIRSAVFHEAGGLDEALRVSFNDIDLCLRVSALGYRILWTPHVRLLHLESASRGRADQGAEGTQSRAEHDHLRARWGDRMDIDPYFNPNLDLIGEEVLGLTRPARDAR